MTKIGLDGVAYATAELHMDEANPTYLELGIVEEIDQEFSHANATLGNRASNFTKHAPGQTTFSYTLTTTYEKESAAYQLLENALVNRTVIGLAVMDNDMTSPDGSKGWILDVQVFEGPKKEALNEFDKVAFVCRPSAKSTFEPQRLVIPAT